MNWSKHIINVSATFELLGFDVETDEFTENIGVQPTFVRRGVWACESRPLVESSDVNEHIRYLLRRLLPAERKINELRPNVSALMAICWATNKQLGNTGPRIDSDCICGLAKLGATLSLAVSRNGAKLKKVSPRK